MGLLFLALLPQVYVVTSDAIRQIRCRLVTSESWASIVADLQCKSWVCASQLCDWVQRWDVREKAIMWLCFANLSGLWVSLTGWISKCVLWSWCELGFNGCYWWAIVLFCKSKKSVPVEKRGNISIFCRIILIFLMLWTLMNVIYFLFIFFFIIPIKDRYKISGRTQLWCPGMFAAISVNWARNGCRNSKSVVSENAKKSYILLLKNLHYLFYYHILDTIFFFILACSTS